MLLGALREGEGEEVGQQKFPLEQKSRESIWLHCTKIGVMIIII